MSTDSDVATGVNTGLAVAAVACALLPPPADGFCEAGVAIAKALAALGEWLTAEFRDTYHPTMSDSEAWLTLSRIHPFLAMSDIDKSDLNAHNGAMMMRYWMVTSGETPQGKKGNNGLLHNPHLQVGEHTFNCENPYQCKDDPDEPMSSELIMSDVLARYNRWVASGGGKNLKALSVMVPTIRRHPSEAKLILSSIRKYPAPFKAQMGLAEITDALDQIQEQIRALRLIAGEDGPDPGHQLEAIFGGDLTVHQATKDPSLNLPFEAIYPYEFAGRWVHRGTVKTGKLTKATQGYVTPGVSETTTGAAPTYPAGTPVYADDDPTRKQQYGAYDSHRGWVRVHVMNLGVNDPYSWFWVPTDFVAWPRVTGRTTKKKKASGAGAESGDVEDKTTGYLVLAGALTLTLGAFAALTRASRY